MSALGVVIGLGSIGTLGAIIWALVEGRKAAGAVGDFKRVVAEKDKTSAELAFEKDHSERLEAVIASLRKDLDRANAARDPDGVGDRLDDLLRAPADPAKP